ncbi:MAG: hypothetical protein ACP5NW_00105 [Candidatus Woesearchaeota archaeon]
MDPYEDSISKFFLESKNLGERIHTDYMQAKKIFEAIEKNVNFESIIIQTNADELIKECNSFGAVILDWIEQYPRLLNDYREILKIVINALKDVKGITVTQSSNTVNLKFNDKEFIYYFNNNIASNSPNLLISDAHKEEIAKAENKIVQEISEIISLDLYVLTWLNHIEMLNNQYNTKAIAYTIKNISSVNSPELVKDLNAIASWWFELRKNLDKLKEVTKTAVEMDEEVSKELARLFDQENREQIRDTRIRAVKAGLGLLFNFGLGWIPGSGYISTGMELYKSRKIYLDAIKTLKR